MKSKFTIFILLAHFAISVVNNSSMQVNPHKENLFAFIIQFYSLCTGYLVSYQLQNIITCL